MCIRDRRIVEVEEERYRVISPRNGKEENWVNTSSLFSSFAKDEASFEIFLIGLDGGVKMQSNEIVSPDTFIRRIDSMPIRLIELRNRVNN